MHIEHVAIWTSDLERLRAFYESSFGARASRKYVNPVKQFESYFLTFDSGARIEIMRRPSVAARPAVEGEPAGYAHLAIAVGGRAARCIPRTTAASAGRQRGRRWFARRDRGAAGRVFVGPRAMPAMAA